MRNILIVARKEIQEGLRNRWVLATTLLLAGLALSLTFLGSAPTGTVGVRALDVVIVSLSSLTIFLLPLIALLISHDAIVGEMERGTMLLLLSYPVGRWQVLLGKFLGHLAVLAFATCLGYGLAVGALAATGSQIDADSLLAFVAMIGSSVLLGATFVAIGYLVSALVRDRGTAAGICIGLWLFLVLIYDMALLGVLALDQGRNICTAVSIPMIGDGDTGFGSAQNIKRTVDGYASAGFACIMLEDQVAPKRCGHTEGKSVVSREEAVGVPHERSARSDSVATRAPGAWLAEALAVLRSSLAARRFPSSASRSPLAVPRPPLAARRPPAPVPRSPISALRSPFSGVSVHGAVHVHLHVHDSRACRLTPKPQPPYPEAP